MDSEEALSEKAADAARAEKELLAAENNTLKEELKKKNKINEDQKNQLDGARRCFEEKADKDFKRFCNLHTQLKRTESELLAYRLKFDQADKAMKALKKELENAQTKAGAAEAHTAATQEKLKEAQAQLAEAHTTVEAHENQLAALKEKLGAATDSISNLEEEKVKLEEKTESSDRDCNFWKDEALKNGVALEAAKEEALKKEKALEAAKIDMQRLKKEVGATRRTLRKEAKLRRDAEKQVEEGE
uniref:Myosin_tail_1 domain-containing protein n=1 Tax=Caenorhabditis tropicalis TaxID=1561998 RepID=A0A1I7V3W3_9PELO